MKTNISFVVAILCIVLFSFSALGSVTINGKQYEVIDTHLHIGKFDFMPNTGVEFLVKFLPMGKACLPAVTKALTDPYNEHIGAIKNLQMAGIDKGLLLAVWTTYTTGYATNSFLEELLLDDRNKAADGSPLFWGLVSVNPFGWDAPGEKEKRLSIMASYLKQRPDLFKGIKMAHAHQGIKFNDSNYYAIYDVAAEYGVPVLLHTGFSPFPGSKDTPEYYDPIYLEEAIKLHDGLNDDGSVNSKEGYTKFVLAHAGSGDKRAILNTIWLMEKYSNVYIDLSALNGVFDKDENGETIPEDQKEADPDLDIHSEQLGYFLKMVKEKGLARRVVFATDGPQYSGMLEKYLQSFIEVAQDVGFSEEELAGILAGNARALFKLP